MLTSLLRPAVNVGASYGNPADSRYRIADVVNAHRTVVTFEGTAAIKTENIKDNPGFDHRLPMINEVFQFGELLCSKELLLLWKVASSTYHDLGSRGRCAAGSMKEPQASFWER